MPVNAHWLDNDENTEIVHIEFIGAWTWDEFWDCINNVLDPMLLSTTEKPCTICDIRQSTKLPPDAINQSTRMVRGGTKWDLTVIVGNNQFAKMLVGIVTRLLPNLGKAFTMTGSMEDAKKAIADHRAKAAKH